MRQVIALDESSFVADSLKDAQCCSVLGNIVHANDRGASGDRRKARRKCPG